MYKRGIYLKKIRPFVDKPVIKVITGMRRVGKSYFLKQIINELKNKHINKDAILYINKELLEFDSIQNYRDLNDYVKKSFQKIKGKKYLFLDEVQEIEKWEKAVSSFLAEKDIDIYITGSNAHLLSSEIATLISGRYVEIPMYALSFREFLQFRDEKKQANIKEFKNYLHFGGLPGLHNFDLNNDASYQYLSSVYNTILLKDIISRHRIRNIHLLENVLHFVFDNIGNIFSAKRIADYLKSQKLRVGVATIQTYLSYFLETYLIYRVGRYDIKGKRMLEIYEKFFMGDIGIKHALLGYKNDDISGLLENIIYLELCIRGYTVSVGKLNDREIDFIATKNNKKIYIQVAYLLTTKKVVAREFGILQKIKDNYPKYVLSMDEVFSEDNEGIKRRNIIDFLLSDELV